MNILKKYWLGLLGGSSAPAISNAFLLEDGTSFLQLESEDFFLLE